MSILIKGMGMPKDGDWRIVKINPNGTIDRSIGFGDWALIKGLEAIEIPPHGPLIDMDDFLQEWSELESYRTAMELCEVIEAEPPEDGET